MFETRPMRVVLVCSKIFMQPRERRYAPCIPGMRGRLECLGSLRLIDAGLLCSSHISE